MSVVPCRDAINSRLTKRLYGELSYKHKTDITKVPTYPAVGARLQFFHKEPKALIVVGTSCKLAPAKGASEVGVSGQKSDVGNQPLVTID